LLWNVFLCVAFFLMNKADYSSFINNFYHGYVSLLLKSIIDF
jgi:hypothetical protein